MDNNVNNISFSFSTCGYVADAEHAEIIRRLRKYGIKSTGNKSLDRQILHRLELKDAEKESGITTKFLTVSRGEQEKIQAKKKEKRIEKNPTNYPNSMKGAKILGEQIMLAIKMKKELDKAYKKRKDEDKSENTST